MSRPSPTTRRVGARLIASVMVSLLLGGGTLGFAGPDAATMVGAADTNRVFRFAFMANMFPEVNENDARAAMKVWIQEISQAQQVAADPNPVVFRNPRELTDACQTSSIDGVGLTALEYAELGKTLKFDRLGIATYDGGRITEQYVVLVRADGAIGQLSQLAGRKLNVLESPRASLAIPWLDNELVASGQKRCSSFFSKLIPKDKASLAILPVFFHQVDACLTTSNNFMVMGEMNPQLLTQLRILAISPALIPAFFAFRAREGNPLKPTLFLAMTKMHETAGGKQMLTLVKADRIIEQPLECLQPTLELLARHDRLCGEEIPGNIGQ